MFDISADFAKFERSLSDAAQKQLPFAMMLAINDTTKEMKLAEERQLERQLDNPTPYTKRGVYQQRASKSKLAGAVGIKDRQASYLKRQVQGGVRKPKGRALVLGVGLRRNKYGNLPKSAIARGQAKPGTFVIKMGRGGSSLKPGIYQRGKGRAGSGKIKMLASFVPSARYRKRFEFHGTAERAARGAFASHLVRRMKEAMKSAK